jgi:Uma2 family endonuclease
MTTATAEPETLADVVRALGDIPLHRILWQPFPGTATEEHLLRSRQAELVDGMLVRKSLGMCKALTEVVIGTCLVNHVKPGRLGAVTMASGPYRVGPGTVRLPDVAFIRWRRLLTDAGQVPDIAPVAPDVVVEIPTEENTPGELARKYREYFSAGTNLIWEIDLDARTVEVYAGPARPDLMTLLRETDTLDGGAALPGFALPLTDLFNDPQPNPRR